MRIAAPSFVVAVFYTSPMVEAVMFLAINILAILYIAICNPFADKLNLVQILFLEIVMLTVHVCVLIITMASGSSDTLSLLGNIVIICNFIININFYVFLIVKAIVIYKRIRGYKTKGMASEKAAALAQLIFLPFQQSGFGYESMQAPDALQNAAEKVKF